MTNDSLSAVRGVPQSGKGTWTAMREAIEGAGLRLREVHSWVWDPRPTTGPEPRFKGQARGKGWPCPFLGEEEPLYEAHALWNTDEGRALHLLVVANAGLLRWRWRRVDLQEMPW